MSFIASGLARKSSRASIVVSLPSLFVLSSTTTQPSRM
jgi:hypothetical protein